MCSESRYEWITKQICSKENSILNNSAAVPWTSEAMSLFRLQNQEPCVIPTVNRVWLLCRTLIIVGLPLGSSALLWALRTAGGGLGKLSCPFLRTSGLAELWARVGANGHPPLHRTMPGSHPICTGPVFLKLRLHTGASRKGEECPLRGHSHPNRRTPV